MKSSVSSVSSVILSLWAILLLGEQVSALPQQSSSVTVPTTISPSITTLTTLTSTVSPEPSVSPGVGATGGDSLQTLQTTTSQFEVLHVLLNTTILTGKQYRLQDSPSSVGFSPDGVNDTIEVTYGANRYFNINPLTNSFSNDFTLILEWHDLRLGFLNENILNSTGAILVDNPMGSIWTPSVVFPYLAVDAGLSSTPVYEDCYLVADGSGRVIWTRQFSYPFSMKWALQQFPYDIQTLNIQFRYGKSSGHQRLVWSNNGTNYDQIVGGFSSSLWTVESWSNDSLPDRSDTPLLVTLTLRRGAMPYVTRFIIPMVVLSLAACLSFWIEGGTFPARFTGLVALLLATVTLNIVVNTELPRVTYLTTMDYYTLSTFLFIFFGILMSTTVYSLKINGFPIISESLEVFLRIFGVLAVPCVYLLVYLTRDTTAKYPPAAIGVLIVFFLLFVVSAVVATMYGMRKAAIARAKKTEVPVQRPF